MLEALHALGFDTVVATPHMRPGLWDNPKSALEEAFERAKAELPESGVPEVALSCEHYFDHTVFARILAGEGLPYPGDKAVLLEFYDQEMPPTLAQRRANGAINLLWSKGIQTAYLSILTTHVIANSSTIRPAAASRRPAILAARC